MIFETAKRYFSYEDFLDHAEKEVQLNELHPERVEDPKYAYYTKLNLQRMKRWNKTFLPDANLIERLKSTGSEGQTWWVITEAWCGDSAQNLPIIAALAAAAGIELRIVLRDENPGVIDRYLTNGTKSIPVLVAFDKKSGQLFRWGPRPAAAQELMAAWKADPKGRDFEAFELEMHQWYTSNKGIDVQDELAQLVK